MLSFSHVSVQNLKLYQQKVSRTLGKQQEINTKKKQENKDRTECSTSSQKEKKKEIPHTVIQILKRLINGALFSVFATALSTPAGIPTPTITAQVEVQGQQRLLWPC